MRTKKLFENKDLFRPILEYNEHDKYEIEMEERLEAEKAWEAAFEEGERLARETSLDEEDW